MIHHKKSTEQKDQQRGETNKAHIQMDVSQEGNAQLPVSAVKRHTTSRKKKKKKKKKKEKRKKKKEKNRTCDPVGGVGRGCESMSFLSPLSLSLSLSFSFSSRSLISILSSLCLTFGAGLYGEVEAETL